MATLKLLDGNTVPQLGLGTWDLRRSEGLKVMQFALANGYSHFDTAAFYRNEDLVGKAIHTSDRPREEIFVTTKVWPSDLGIDKTRKAFDKSMALLNLEYVDMYLIHWPGDSKQRRVDAYQTMMALRDEERIKSVGVSNFSPTQLTEIKDAHGEWPAMNQVKFSAFSFPQDVYEFCQANKIIITAYEPINKGRGFNHPTLQTLSEKYNKTVAQILLRWTIEKGVVTIPKTSKQSRIIENAAIFDFSLGNDEVKKLDQL